MKKLVDIYQVNGVLDWYTIWNYTTKIKAKAQATQYAVPPADPADPTGKSLHVEAP